MEDKLVTLAIHTFEKAQILKTILETEGIEVYIHNVNLIHIKTSRNIIRCCGLFYLFSLLAFLCKASHLMPGRISVLR